MNTLTVFKFGTPEGAQEMLNNVYKMQNES